MNFHSGLSADLRCVGPTEKMVDALSVRCLRAALSISHPQRSSASLIGCLGQARFPSILSMRSYIRVTLLFAVWFGVRSAPLHACVGMEVESPAFRRASSCAADIFSFIFYLTEHIYMPEKARTSSGWDDPVRLGGRLLVHAVPPTCS